jgi:hypothetical protein
MQAPGGAAIERGRINAGARRRADRRSPASAMHISRLGGADVAVMHVGCITRAKTAGRAALGGALDRG